MALKWPIIQFKTYLFVLSLFTCLPIYASEFCHNFYLSQNKVTSISFRDQVPIEIKNTLQQITNGINLTLFKNLIVAESISVNIAADNQPSAMGHFIGLPRRLLKKSRLISFIKNKWGTLLTNGELGMFLHEFTHATLTTNWMMGIPGYKNMMGDYESLILQDRQFESRFESLENGKKNRTISEAEYEKGRMVLNVEMTIHQQNKLTNEQLIFLNSTYQEFLADLAPVLYFKDPKIVVEGIKASAKHQLYRTDLKIDDIYSEAQLAERDFGIDYYKDSADFQNVDGAHAMLTPLRYFSWTYFSNNGNYKQPHLVFEQFYRAVTQVFAAEIQFLNRESKIFTPIQRVEKIKAALETEKSTSQN